VNHWPIDHNIELWGFLFASIDPSISDLACTLLHFVVCSIISLLPPLGFVLLLMLVEQWKIKMFKASMKLLLEIGFAITLKDWVWRQWNDYYRHWGMLDSSKLVKSGVERCIVKVIWSSNYQLCALILSLSWKFLFAYSVVTLSWDEPLVPTYNL
jgi:hypothetical protein